MGAASIRITVAIVSSFLPANANGEAEETPVGAADSFVRALYLGDTAALARAVSFPMRFGRAAWDHERRPYKRCARDIKDAEALAIWRTCVDRWDPAMFSWLKLWLRPTSRTLNPKLESGSAKAPRALRALMKTAPTERNGTWVTGIPVQGRLEYHMLFYVTSVEGHPRVAAFFLLVDFREC